MEDLEFGIWCRGRCAGFLICGGGGEASNRSPVVLFRINVLAAWRIRARPQVRLRRLSVVRTVSPNQCYYHIVRRILLFRMGFFISLFFLCILLAFIWQKKFFFFVRSSRTYTKPLKSTALNPFEYSGVMKKKKKKIACHRSRHGLTADPSVSRVQGIAVLTGVVSYFQYMYSQRIPKGSLSTMAVFDMGWLIRYLNSSSSIWIGMLRILLLFYIRNLLYWCTYYLYAKHKIIFFSYIYREIFFFQIREWYLIANYRRSNTYLPSTFRSSLSLIR